MNLQKKLANLLASTKRKRPYYCEVEYLKSTGTQYINTLYKPNTNTRTVGRVRFNSFVGSSANYIFGVFSSPNNYGLNVGSARQYFNVPWGSNSGIQLNGLIPQLNTDYDFDISKTGNKINGTSYGSLSTELVNSTRNMYLFWSNGTSASGMNGRIYYCKIWDDSVVVRDFIPVLGWDGKGYMYDKVSGQLFGNAGTGDFVAGRQIHRVDYLEANGTQYIDTGYAFNSNTDTIELGYQNTSTQTHKWLFGSYESNANIGISCGTVSVPTFWYKGSIASTESAQYNSEHILRYDSAGMSNDGINLKAFTSYTGTWDLYLFALNNTGTSPNGYFGYGKIYSYTHKRNGSLVRDFIPAIDENGVGFMFDRVSHTCFLNQGTGVFSYPAREVEYLQSSGTQYIDTGWTPISNDLRVNFRTKSMSSPSATAICGAEKNGITPRWVFIMYGQSADATKTYPLTGDWNNNDKGFTFTSGSVLEIDWTTSSTSTTIIDSVSGTTYTKTFGSTINYSNNNITLKLFQNADNQKSSIQINYYKIWDGGVLVRDFIPCYKDGQSGMWDKVNGVFYPNVGTGDFIAGKIKEK